MALFVYKVMKFCTSVPVHTYMYVCKNIKPKCLKYMAKCDFTTGIVDCNKLKYVITSSAILPEKAQTLRSVLSQHSDKICT